MHETIGIYILTILVLNVVLYMIHLAMQAQHKLQIVFSVSLVG